LGDFNRLDPLASEISIEPRSRIRHTVDGITVLEIACAAEDLAVFAKQPTFPDQLLRHPSPWTTRTTPSPGYAMWVQRTANRQTRHERSLPRALSLTRPHAEKRRDDGDPLKIFCAIWAENRIRLSGNGNGNGTHQAKECQREVSMSIW
jgi:hypothetical protein